VNHTSDEKNRSPITVTEENKSGKQKDAEAEVEDFRKDLGPFVIAAQSTRMAMAFTDAEEPDHPVIFANDSFLSLTGYSREEVLAQSFINLMADGDEPGAKIAAAFQGHPDINPEVRCHRKDGSALWAALYVSPVMDEKGNIVQHFVSLADLTRQRREEDRLRFLLSELNHRAQNMLATVLGIAGQTLRGKADTDVVDAFERRILALSSAHSLLGQENWDRLNLRDVIDQILEPFGVNDHRVTRFSVVGDDVRVQPKAALTLAMVVHEMATNAVKHGAFSNDAEGHVDIAWQVEPGLLLNDQLRLRWQESGGPPVKSPTHKGFGSRLIELGLAQELDGEVRLDYDPAGVVCQMIMPLPGDGLMSHG
jgi:PAS domain S-box-containing protein